MTPRKRILLVKPVLPFPPDQGTKVVSFGIVEALAEAFDVTVLARILDRNEEEAARALETHGVRVVTVLPANRRNVVARVAFKAGYTFRSLVSARSLKGQYDCPGAFVRAARVLARESFSLVVLEYWQLHPLLDVFGPERSVLLTHDIDLVVNRQRARLETSWLARMRTLRRGFLEGREETRAYRRARRILALTQHDADLARALAEGGAEVDVLPFGLPADRFVAVAAARPSREVLFLGAMGASFNRDALAHFARDIHPALAGIPGIRFVVVGGAAPRQLRGFAGASGVDMVGHARDTGPFLRRAACMVVPLRYGGGLRIRIIEAMAGGLPVVASPAAVRGLNVEPDRHILVAESPAQYRTSVERLLDDSPYATALAERARQHAWSAYGPWARGPALRDCLERLAQ